MKRVLRTLGWLFALLLLGLVIGVWYLTGTASGLRWALAQAENRMGGALQVGAVQGSLLQGVRLHDVRFQNTGLTLEVDQLQAQWRPAALLQGMLRVQSLYVQGIRVHTEPSDQPQESAFPPQFRTPIGVSLPDAVVEDFALRQGDQPPLVIERIELGATLRGNRLRLRHLTLRGPELQLSSQGRVQLGGDYAVDLSVQWALQVRGERWSGGGTVKGDRSKVRVLHSLEAPLQAQLAAQLQDIFDRTRWQANLDVAAFDADRLLRRLDLQPDSAAAPQLGRVELHASLHGDRSKAVLEPLAIRIPDGDRSVRLHGAIEGWRGDSPTADLALEWRNLQWPLQQSAQIASARGSAQLNGGLDDFRLRLDTVLSVPAVPATLQVNGAVRSQGEDLHVEQLVARDPDGAARVQLQGTVGQWRSAAPQLDLNGRWQELRWPLQGTPQVTSAEGTFSLRGDLEDYRFGTELQLAAAELPSSHWQIAGQGDLGQVHFQTIQAQLLDGSLKGSGSVAWQAPLQWQFALQLADLNPGVIDSAWPGKLSAEMRVSGALPEAGPSLQLVLEQIRGTLRQRSFQAQARVALDNRRWQIERLNVQAGNARLDVHGDYGERLDLAWKLDAGQLADLLPDAAGSLHASGSLQGAAQAPRLQAQLKGENLRWRDYGAAALQGKLAGGVGQQQSIQIDLQGTQLSAAGMDAERLRLTGSGTTERHRLALQVEQTGGSLEVALAGGLEQSSAWTGELRQLRVQRERLGTWQLQQPTPLTLAADHAALDRACVQRRQAGLCASGRWQAAEGWSGKVEVTQLPLAALAGLFPEGIRLTGTLNGNAELAASAGRLSKVDAELRLSAGDLRYRADAEHVVEESFGGGLLRVQQQQQQVVGKLQIDLSGQDRVNGEVRVSIPETAAQAWSQSRLDGEIQLHMARWDIVEVFVPQISGVDGSLNGRLALAGTVGQPQFSGDARFRARQIELPAAGTVLKDVDLRVADAGGGALQLQGSVRSGDGVVRLEGRFEIQGGNPWRTQLQLTGDRFLAVNTAEAKVYVSPDLQIKAEPKRIDVSGELTVPEAQLTPREGRSAVKPSSDVVVVRQDQPKADKQAAWGVYADLRLKLGDKVRFTGYGFDGRVSGALTLKDVPDKITTATGALDIHDATYSAYGKTLNVDRGSLTYSGNPVTNPGLDLVATRTVDDKRVGVLVSGTASNPRLELFSNPSMSDGDILAYLVLGRPLNSAGQADGQALMAAATSVGLSKGSALAESIGQQLGFQDVSVTREANSDQPWLTVGRYLSPKLYVSYGVGLFEPGSVVRIRYELTDHWKVQGESGGASSGADLLYTIER